MLTRRERARKYVKRFKLLLTQPAGRATPLFIFGMQRSGTNMLGDIFSRNAQVECFSESDEEAFDDYRLRPEATIARLIARAHARLVVFKPICDSQHATRILETYPGARAVWLYRHYTDVVNSAVKLFPGHSQQLGNMVRRPELAGWRVENVTPEDMELVRHLEGKGLSTASGHAVIWYLRNRLYYQQGLDKDPRVLLVNYERLVADPASQFARVARFAGIEPAASDTAGVFSSSVGRSKAPEIDEEIRSLCDPLYAQLEATLQGAASAPEGALAGAPGGRLG